MKREKSTNRAECEIPQSETRRGSKARKKRLWSDDEMWSSCGYHTFLLAAFFVDNKITVYAGLRHSDTQKKRRNLVCLIIQISCDLMTHIIIIKKAKRIIARVWGQGFPAQSAVLREAHSSFLIANARRRHLCLWWFWWWFMSFVPRGEASLCAREEEKSTRDDPSAHTTAASGEGRRMSDDGTLYTAERGISVLW